MRYAVSFLILFWIGMVATTPGAETLLVGPGEEYSTIQSAIDDASGGDVVQVLPGKYESVVLKERVDVVGAGAEQTIISSISESFPEVTVGGSDNVTLRGFTITGGYYGIRCNGVSPTITDCVIGRNSWCGILMEGSSATIARCVISQNPRYGVECLDSSAPNISNCTFSANGTGIRSASSAPILTNCILWGDRDDLEGIADGGSISHCNIRDGDFAGENGNISADPAFVSWGAFNDSDNPLYVRVGHAGPEKGTRENPFTRIASALAVHSYHLGLGSPCLNVGEGGVHMGAYPEEEASQAPGGNGVVVNVAAGTYYEGRLFACHGAEIRGPEGSPARIIASGQTVFYALGVCSVENFAISGGDDAVDCFFSEALVSNCVISQCGQNGVYSFEGNPRIQGCHMFDNYNVGVLLEGGSGSVSDCFIGTQAAAGISCIGLSSATVWNCLLTESPVGLSCAGGANVELRNSTVTNAGWKGIQAREGASVTIVDSIVRGNPFGDVSEEGGSIQGTFSNIGGGLPGEGNIDADPLFETGPLGNFYLDSDSPCIDRGSDTAESLSLGDKTTLLSGELDSGMVDMGYHYRKFEIVGLTETDGQVTLEWTATPGLDYTILRTSALGAGVFWEAAGELTASWMRQGYSLDETSASAAFYRVRRAR